MHHHAVLRAPAARLAPVAFITATLASSHVLAQAPIALLRDQDGAVRCIVSRLPIASLTTDPPSSADPTDLVVDIRAPGAPSAGSMLAPGRRDFTRLPIEVHLMPPGADSGPTSGKPIRIESQVVETGLTRGAADEGVFVRVTYRRGLLGPGVEIVASRTAVAAGGEKVIAQTRCRIREEDAAQWR